MFGTEDQPKVQMTWDNLQKCKKLHHCIYEAMRLHPTLPNIGRQAIRDTILPTGGGDDGKQPIAVAKGTVVMCCLYLMHRRSEEWGADTNKYEPERCVYSLRLSDFLIMLTYLQGTDVILDTSMLHSGEYERPRYREALLTTAQRRSQSLPRSCVLPLTTSCSCLANLLAELFALVEMYYVTARIMQRFKAFKQSDKRVGTASSGAGVLIPPEGAMLSVQVAE